MVANVFAKARRELTHTLIGFGIDENEAKQELMHVLDHVIRLRPVQ